MRDTVFIATPTYSEDINTGSARALWHLATRGDSVRLRVGTRSSSLVPGSCNNLLCEAMNERESHNIKWFAMLHGDIEPEAYWVDKLIEIANESSADMLSVVVPIKDPRGVTSTAIASGDERTQFCRLTQRQVWHESFPSTFDIYECAGALESLPGELCVPVVPRVGLRLNTGCMIVRMDRPWMQDGSVFFENIDWIERTANGWRARDISEDWRFSQKIQEAGGRLLATRAVRLVHKGFTSFPNNLPWGELASDAPKQQEAAA